MRDESRETFEIKITNDNKEYSASYTDSPIIFNHEFVEWLDKAMKSIGIHSLEEYFKGE